MLGKMITSRNLLLVHTGLALALLIVVAQDSQKEDRIILEPPTMEVQDDYPTCSQEAGQMCMYQGLGKAVFNGTVNITGYFEDDISHEQVKVMAQTESDFEYTYYICVVDFSSCPVVDPVTDCYCMSKDDIIYYFVVKFTATSVLSGKRLRAHWVTSGALYTSNLQPFPVVWRLTTLAPTTTPQYIKTQATVQRENNAQPITEFGHMTTSAEVQYQDDYGHYESVGPFGNSSLGNKSAASMKASTATASEISLSVNTLFLTVVLGIVWQACLFYTSM